MCGCTCRGGQRTPPFPWLNTPEKACVKSAGWGHLIPSPSRFTVAGCHRQRRRTCNRRRLHSTATLRSQSPRVLGLSIGKRVRTVHVPKSHVSRHPWNWRGMKKLRNSGTQQARGETRGSTTSAQPAIKVSITRLTRPHATASPSGRYFALARSWTIVCVGFIRNAWAWTSPPPKVRPSPPHPIWFAYRGRLFFISPQRAVWQVRDAQCHECNNESPAVLSMMGFVISRPTTPKAILTSITPSYNHPLPLPSFADPLPRHSQSQASAGMLG